MLIGEYLYNIDNKGRLCIPSNFREVLGDTFIVSKGLDNSLFVYSISEWENFKIKIAQLEMAGARNLQRFFFSSAFEAQLDKQGRILIPQALREYAVLSKDVVVIGVSSRVEIWDRDKWNAISSELTADNIATAMEKIGF